jgi:hypothetical protein
MNKSMKRSMINNNVWYKSMLAGNIPSDYELIATANGTGSSSTITFSSIPTDYKHLQIRYSAKTTSTTGEDLYIRFNGILSASYVTHSLQGRSTTASSSSNTGLDVIFLERGLATTDTPNSFAAGVIDILDYASTSKNTTLRAFYGKNDNNNNVQLRSGLLMNTAAINSISLITSAGSHTTTTRFSLYGLKG